MPSMRFSDLVAQVPSIAENASRNIGVDPLIQGAAPNHSAKPGTIAFYENVTTKGLLTDSQPSALIQGPLLFISYCCSLPANAINGFMVAIGQKKCQYADILTF